MKKLFFIIIFIASAALASADVYTKASCITGCPAWILHGIAITESWEIDTAIGDDGISIGRMQLNEKYHAERARKYGEYNPLNPEQSVLIAGYIMAHNLSVFSDYRDAIAAYRQGVTGVRRHGRTDWYVNRVVHYGKHSS